jgi:hypothetical protein
MPTRMHGGEAVHLAAGGEPVLSKKIVPGKPNNKTGWGAEQNVVSFGTPERLLEISNSKIFIHEGLRIG